MGIREQYMEHFTTPYEGDDDFFLKPFGTDCYYGVDRDGHTALVEISSTSNGTPIVQRTRCLQVECNVGVSFSVAGKSSNKVVHVLKFLGTDLDERNLFLEMAGLFVDEQDRSATAFLQTFQTLEGFFADESELTKSELQGLYAELLTIVDFDEELELGRFWQSHSKMKFDFSISPKLKLEVKSTIKPNRIHHFQQEQVFQQSFEMYICSYLLIEDDEGLSLLELIEACKRLLGDDPRKVVELNKVLYRAGETRLSQVRFSQNKAREQRLFFYSGNIPHYQERTPEGISNVQFDCDLSNCKAIPTPEFVAIAKTAIG